MNPLTYACKPPTQTRPIPSREPTTQRTRAPRRPRRSKSNYLASLKATAQSLILSLSARIREHEHRGSLALMSDDERQRLFGTKLVRARKAEVKAYLAQRFGLA